MSALLSCAFIQAKPMLKFLAVTLAELRVLTKKPGEGRGSSTQEQAPRHRRPGTQAL